VHLREPIITEAGNQRSMRLLSDGVQGFRFPFQSVPFLFQHRALWKWALLPALVNVVVFAAAFAVFLWAYPSIYDLVTSFLQVESPATWYGWLWIAPLRALAWIIGVLLILASIAILYLVFLLLGTIIASPFLDVLAQRVEEVATHQIAEERLTLGGVWRSFFVSMVAELRRAGFFFAVQIALLLLGFIPLLAPLTVGAATLFTVLFLPLQYAGFTMDHRLLTFAQRRRLVWQHRWIMLGFGVAAFLTLLVPLLNFICLPILVVAGTRLFLHIERRVQSN
jgi:CysZ protein